MHIFKNGFENGKCVFHKDRSSVAHVTARIWLNNKNFGCVCTNFVGRAEFKLLPCSQVNSTWHTATLSHIYFFSPQSKSKNVIDKTKRETNSQLYEPPLICLFPQIMLLKWSSRDMKVQFIVRLRPLTLSVMWSVQYFVRTALGTKCLHMSNFTLDQQSQWM